MESPTSPEQSTQTVAFTPKINEASLPAGSRFGDYVLVRLLGRGGMGQVYEAEHIESGRRVALKMLTQPLGAARERFLREGRLAASVSHPHCVYVFGTEEIHDTPAILMELVSGGTLSELVKRNGAMAPTPAVDSILQVVAGLNAAYEKGILHRDIKPANCFVETGGTVKVGDFGLALSSVVRDEQALTVDGSFLGTPAFASPEQLRGEELDVRSDIYSVGATLYFLLTGKLPFEKQGVSLIAEVLNRVPDAPAKLKKSIPKELSSVVMKCLAKEPKARFAAYAALEEALASFSSATPEPAGLAVRTIAYLIDTLFLGLLLIPFGPDKFSAWVLDLVEISEMFIYFAVSERLWGASLGKAVFGLRVLSQGDSLGWSRALYRTALFCMISFPGNILLSLSIPAKEIWAGGISFLMLGILFSRARRANGFAGIHELLSGTRVVVKSRARLRERFQMKSPEPPLPQASEQRIGPYSVVEGLGETSNGRLWLGFDPALHRSVWIQVPAAGTPPVAPSRRDAQRPGRLRWLAGKRSADEAWDAYEAPGGGALADFAVKPQPWRVVRYWLKDLIEEANDGAQTDAGLALDRVWIAADGRALLLDFPAPGARNTTDAEPLRPQTFLSQVAGMVLGGGGHVPLPIAVREFLDRLRGEDRIGAAELRERLNRLIGLKCEVGVHGRILPAMVCGALPFIFTALFTAGTLVTLYTDAKYADVSNLPSYLRRVQVLRRDQSPEALRERLVVESYVAGKFRLAIRDPLVRFPPPGSRTEGLLEVADSVLAAHPSIKAEDLRTISVSPEVARAKHIHSPPSTPTVAEQPSHSLAYWLGRTMRRTAALTSPQGTRRSAALPVRRFGAVFVSFFWFLPCVISVFVGMVARRGLLKRVFGVEIVGRDGMNASRARLVWRGMLAMAPTLLAFPIVLLPIGEQASLFVFFVAAVIMAVEFVWMIVVPGQSIADRLAGTYQVPR